MLSFKKFLVEEAEGEKLKHIVHAEDRPLQHGSEGFKHAVNALNQAHEHIKSGGHSSALTMKYDGSPAVVFGHHPETGKFFVASKSAFNKDPKINYTHKDIMKNHGHAPGLVEKLHSALNHLRKISPKSGVYQGDLMYSEGDKKEKKGGKVSFTPNTISYTAKGDMGEKIKNSKMGIIVHTQYHGKDIHTMSADPHPDLHNFSHHPDVWHQSANHDTKQIHYPEEAQQEYKEHIHAAQQIHDANRGTMYKATEMHRGSGGHLEQYINHTVRTGEEPHAEGFKSFLQNKHDKDLASKVKKLKTPAGVSRAQSLSGASLKQHHNHIDANTQHYDNLLSMHNHLQKAKNVLVSHLEQHEGGLEHHIGNKRSKPEGFVVNHAGEPTKLVNRAEFARANLLKVRK
jgi:hypothetical protein